MRIYIYIYIEENAASTQFPGQTLRDAGFRKLSSNDWLQILHTQTIEKKQKVRVAYSDTARGMSRDKKS